MIIPVDIERPKDKDGRETAIGVIHPFVSCHRPSFRKPLKFMIDTGFSQECCITDKELDFLGFELTHSGVQALPEDKCLKGFGGIVPTYVIRNISLWCKGNEDGNDVPYKIEIPKVCISKDTPLGLPNVLGVQFLLANNMRLVFSPNTDDGSYLEML